LKELGGIGGVSLISQLIGTGLGVVIAFAGGYVVYGTLKKIVGIRLDPKKNLTVRIYPSTKFLRHQSGEGGW